jgi:hypothetical protein
MPLLSLWSTNPDAIESFKIEQVVAAAGQVALPCSILIVVGREDTGELEAQIRGSRHAWDIRLISTDALVKLVQLKEGAEGPDTAHKIRNVLVPMEYTRLDGLIDVVFTTAKDVEAVAEIAPDDEEEEADATSSPTEQDSEQGSKAAPQFTEYKLIQAKREDIMNALGRRENNPLIKKNGALYWNSEHTIQAACTVSKRYTKKGALPYWYAYHPTWDAFLGEVKNSFLVLGCMDKDAAFAVSIST